MMEQPESCEAHGYAVLVAALDHIVITDGAAGLGDVMYAAAVSSLDIVAEGEERVRTETHAGQLIEPCSLLLAGKHLGLNGKCLLPLTENIHVVVADVDIIALSRSALPIPGRN